MWFGAAACLCVAQYPVYVDLPAIRAEEGRRSMLRDGQTVVVLQQCQRARPAPLLLPVALCDATMSHLPASAADWDATDDFGL
jgi:hypothetical protein